MYVSPFRMFSGKATFCGSCDGGKLEADCGRHQASLFRHAIGQVLDIAFVEAAVQAEVECWCPLSAFYPSPLQVASAFHAAYKEKDIVRKHDCIRDLRLPVLPKMMCACTCRMLGNGQPAKYAFCGRFRLPQVDKSSPGMLLGFSSVQRDGRKAQAAPCAPSPVAVSLVATSSCLRGFGSIPPTTRTCPPESLGVHQLETLESFPKTFRETESEERLAWRGYLVLTWSGARAPVRRNADGANYAESNAEGWV